MRALALMFVACGYPALPPLTSDDDAGGDSDIVAITASPSSFDLHAMDTRMSQITVTNNTGANTGRPTIAIAGLTLGTTTIVNDMCTTGLAPGGTCTVTADLTATTAGQGSFAATVTTSPGGSAMVPMSITVMPACLDDCGSNGTANCCDSAIVPGNAVGATNAGEPFFRGYDMATDGTYTSMAHPATVSDFRLDTYVVTVGRFRSFVSAGMGTQASAPASTAGSRTLNGMPNQGGWDAAFNASLALDRTTLLAALVCASASATWTTSAGANEPLPINCVTWYEAEAFCIWDGGYLPTEAEYHYAASGGSEQRAYPWSSPAGSLTIDCTYANYMPTSSTYCVGGANGATNRVGSESPKGDAKWGHADLGSDIFEYVLDFYAAPYAQPTCDNCANLTASADRAARGGSWDTVVPFMRSAFRFGQDPAMRVTAMGFRCARPL
jgi:formylglycine-generating enzyme